MIDCRVSFPACQIPMCPNQSFSIGWSGDETQTIKHLSSESYTLLLWVRAVITGRCVWVCLHSVVYLCHMRVNCWHSTCYPLKVLQLKGSLLPGGWSAWWVIDDCHEVTCYIFLTYCEKSSDLHLSRPSALDYFRLPSLEQLATSTMYFSLISTYLIWAKKLALKSFSLMWYFAPRWERDRAAPLYLDVA